MNLEELQKNWQKFGEEDPLWAILTIPEMKGNNWDPEEFFQRGVTEIGQILQHVAGLKAELSRDRALDFGCGAGRLTQALAAQFNEAHGVDIAPSMIETARKFNKFGEKCVYHLNDQNNLSLFPANHFDFIYSVIVLQHMHPRYSLPYIEEFLRVLRPNGVLVFQLPAEIKPDYVPPLPPTRRRLPSIRGILQRLRAILRRSGSKPEGAPAFKPRMEMHGIPKDVVLALLDEKDGVLLQVRPDSWAGPNWNSYTYFVTKAQTTPVYRSHSPP